MNIQGKIRVAVFTVILIILAYFSVGYTYEIYNVNAEDFLIDTNNIENVNIDGSDFTPIFKMFGIGFNSIWIGITCVLYAFIVLIVSLLLVIPLRFVGIKKDTKITELEQMLSKWLFGGIIFWSVVVGLILTRGTVLVPLLIYTAIWSIVVWLIYIRRICRNLELERVKF